MKLSAALAVASAALAATPLFAQMADPTGTWLTEDKDGIVQIGDCGVLAKAAPTGALCGVVVWIKNPVDQATGKPPTDRHNIDPAKRNVPIMGLQIVSQMRPSRTAGRWDGRVYDLDSGKTYDGSLIVKSATQMRVQGCQFLICQGEEWVRQALPETPKTPARPGNNARPVVAPSVPPPASAQPRAR